MYHSITAGSVTNIVNAVFNSYYNETTDITYIAQPGLEHP